MTRMSSSMMRCDELPTEEEAGGVEGLGGPNERMGSACLRSVRRFWERR